MKKMEIEVTCDGSVVKYTLPFETDEKALVFALNFAVGLKSRTQQHAAKVDMKSVSSVPPKPPAAMVELSTPAAAKKPN